MHDKRLVLENVFWATDYNGYLQNPDMTLNGIHLIDNDKRRAYETLGPMSQRTE